MDHYLFIHTYITIYKYNCFIFRMDDTLTLNLKLSYVCHLYFDHSIFYSSCIRKLASISLSYLNLKTLNLEKIKKYISGL